MKVLYIHHCGTPNGAGKSLLLLLGELQKLGVDIHVVTVDGPIVEDFHKITENVYIIKGIPQLVSIQGLGFLQSIVTNLKSIKYFNETERILKWIDHINPDIIHFNEIGMFHTSYKIRNTFDIPIIFHVRILPKVKFGVIYYLYKSFSRDLNISLFCISQKIYNLFRHDINSYILLNPMITSLQFETNEQAESDDILRVSFVANFIKYKGVDELIDVIKKLKNHCSIEIHIFGSNVKNRKFHDSIIGKTLDKLNLYLDYEKRIQNVISQNSIINVKYHGQTKNVEMHVKDTDLLIAPTRLNELPRAVYEAGMLGIPSIVSLKETEDILIKNFETGVIVEEKQSDEIIEAILYLEKNRDLLKKMGTNAKKLFEKNNNKQTVAENAMGFYKKILNKSL